MAWNRKSSGGSGTSGGLANKGAFNSSTLYKVNDIVKYNNYLYSCKLDTIATPAPSKIAAGTIASDGFLGAASFNDGVFTGTVFEFWSTSHNYIQMTNVANHTFVSAKFYDDLNSPARTLSAISGVTVTVDGTAVTASGAYNSTTKSYDVTMTATTGKIIKYTFTYSGDIQCSEIEVYEVFSTYPDVNVTYWDPFASASGGLTLKGTFDSSMAYKVNDIVKYNDCLYSCKLDASSPPAPANITSLASFAWTNASVVSNAVLQDGSRTGTGVQFNQTPSTCTFTFAANHNFSTLKFYDDTYNPAKGFANITSVIAKIDGVTLSPTLSYNATTTCYTIDFGGLVSGKVISLVFAYSGSYLCCSELEIWETFGSVPSTNTVNWSVFAILPTSPLLALPWTEKFILNLPADTYVSPGLPLSRNATLIALDFYVTNTPASATTVTVKQNGTTIGSVSLIAAGKTSMTIGANTGTADDLFTYTVGGAGLAACTVVCNQKWVNR